MMAGADGDGAALQAAWMGPVVPQHRTHEQRAGDLAAALPELLRHDNPTVRELGEAVRRALREGGDPLQHMGFKPGRGKRNATPKAAYHHNLRKAVLLAIAQAAELPGDPLQHADKIARMLERKDPRAALVLRQVEERGERVTIPKSTKGIVRILRSSAT